MNLKQPSSKIFTEMRTVEGIDVPIEVKNRGRLSLPAVLQE
jgi:hypothetical protein